jgi:tetratricopeptide (TPR) repeat protein
LGKKIIGGKEILDKENFINERCMIKVCELLDDEIIFKFHSDFVVCFLTMGFYEAANSVLDRVEKNIVAFTVEEKIGHEYLRVNVLLEGKKYWEALARAENLLLTYPLIPEEEKCFLYLKAEANFFLGRKKEAKEIYLKIKEASPSYRLVGNRLLEIEINK